MSKQENIHDILDGLSVPEVLTDELCDSNCRFFQRRRLKKGKIGGRINDGNNTGVCKVSKIL